MNRIAWISILLPFAVACAGLGQESFIVSETDEIALGAEFNTQLLAEMPPYQGDPMVAAWVDALGQAIAPVTDRPGLKYTFTVVDSDEINAFAVLGGWVYITTGLLKSATTGADVAAVLAHELGHISARHGVQAMERYLLREGLVGLLGEGDLKDIVAGALGVADVMLFSQDQETESDFLGVQYAVAAGFNAWGLVNFFEILQNLRGSGGEDPGGILTTLGELFSTHPPTSERIQTVKDQLANLGVAVDQPELDWEGTTTLAEIQAILAL